jgi:hypothetical protein
MSPKLLLRLLVRIVLMFSTGRGVKPGCGDGAETAKSAEAFYFTGGIDDIRRVAGAA